MAILQIVGTGAGDLLRSTNGGPTEIFGDVSPTVAGAATAPFGNDTLFGGPGNDTVFGQQGTDSLIGTGNDDLRGGQGADTIIGTGSDSLFGNKDADQLFGGLSAFGGQGNDTIFGSTTGRGELGNDIIYGGTTLIGGNGNDTLVSAAGNQTFTGNESPEDEFNSDQFVFAPATPLTIAGQSITQGGFGGIDTITDFQSGPGLGDIIRVTNLDFGATLTISQVGSDVNIVIAGTTSPQAGSPVPNSDEGSVTTTTNQSANQTIVVRNVNLQQFLAVGSNDLEVNGIVVDQSRVQNVNSATSVFVFTVGERTGVNFDLSALATNPAVINGTSTTVQLNGVPVTTTVNNDTITGSIFSDLIAGLAGNDLLRGNSGNDTIFANAGNDTVFGNGGDAPTAVTVPVSPDNFPFTATTISLSRISDVIYGDFAPDTLQSGNDLIFGDGADISTGADALTSSQGPDFIDAGLGNDTVFAGGDDDIVFGGSGDDVISGNAGSDTIYGGSGNDSLNGNDGNDTLFGGAGNDTFNGGLGTDVISYFGNTEAVGVNLATGVFTGRDAALDVLILNTVEDVRGTDFNDTLTGDAASNQLIGEDGADVLSGADGADTLLGGAGNDSLIGGVGVDSLTGGAGADRFIFNNIADGGDIVTDFFIASSGAAVTGDDFIVLNTAANASGDGDLRFGAAAGLTLSQAAGLVATPGAQEVDFILDNGGLTPSQNARPTYRLDIPTGLFQIDADGTGAGVGFVTIADLPDNLVSFTLAGAIGFANSVVFV